MAKIDPLTALLNRQSYYKDIESLGDKVTGVASVDMNELKYINDNFGHSAGDEAINTIARVLLENCGRGGTAYRIGGDEFVILYENASEETIVGSIDTMRKKMSETKYTCAFGYAMKGKNEKFDDALREADEKMYRDKAEQKKKKNEQTVSVG